jgi:N-methylhydantoinase A
LGITEIVVPSAPGIVCAQGLLVSDLKEDFVASRRFALDEAGTSTLATSVTELSASALHWFDTEKVPLESRNLGLVVDARYVGQNFELAVPVVSGATIEQSDLPDFASLRAAFCAAHETAYGYASEEDPIEIVNIRLSASAKLHEEGVRPTSDGDLAVAQPRETRPVFFDAEKSVEAKVYSRADLKPGYRIVGPAIFEQLDTTTLLYPGDTAVVTPDGHLIIHIDVAAGESA